MFFPYLGRRPRRSPSAHTSAGSATRLRRLDDGVLRALDGVWGHHMFITGGVTNQYFAFTSTLLLVPAGIEYFDPVAR